MARFGVRDIDRLIGLGAGDADALRGVRRALARGEPVSASERDYVLGLIAEHMGPGKRIRPPTVSPPPPRARPTPPLRRIARAARAAPAAARSRASQMPSRRTIAVAAIAVAVVVSAGISLQSMRADVPAPPAPPEPAALSTDRASYSHGEVIVISGTADPGTEVSLSIVGPRGTAWEETVTARADGSYSAMEFAGGEGWEAGAEHAVLAAAPGLEERAPFGYAAP